MLLHMVFSTGCCGCGPKEPVCSLVHCVHTYIKFLGHILMYKLTRANFHKGSHAYCRNVTYNRPFEASCSFYNTLKIYFGRGHPVVFEVQ